MFSWWTWIFQFKWTFILVRNYNVFGKSMDSLYQLHIRLRACTQRGVLIMLLEYSQDRFYSRTRMQNVRSHVVRETVRSESNRPRVLRDQEMLSEVPNRPLLLREFIICSIFKKLVWIGDHSVLPFQYPIYLWVQASAWEVVSIGGWRVLSWSSNRFRNLWFKHRGMQLAV